MLKLWAHKPRHAQDLHLRVVGADLQADGVGRHREAAEALAAGGRSLWVPTVVVGGP